MSKAIDMISVFEIFKIGIGPSSSHTVAPMKAGRLFIKALMAHIALSQIARLRIELFGALSLTGKGHATDKAIILGLAGFEPETIDPAEGEVFFNALKTTQQLTIADISLPFVYQQDLVFHTHFLPLHENGMTFHALDKNGQSLYQQTYYSIGGGFIVEASQFGQQRSNAHDWPFPYHSASEILAHCQREGISIAQLMWQNEQSLQSKATIGAKLCNIWQAMSDCVDRGLTQDGKLPGALQLPRRAPKLYRRLTTTQNTAANPMADPLEIIDWINVYALAVNEENAAGGRVVTAPTNGACGIVPAVLRYYQRFVAPLNDERIHTYLLTAGAIATLYKMNASISGAEVGCQGEVGVACSMAAGGLAALLGASPIQVSIAAEIAMEHNLGLTCDPVGGQVQVPCIERNAIGAVKAVNAARMALMREDDACVDLDKVIETMYETGKDMHAKYRETSTGGLALKVPCD